MIKFSQTSTVGKDLLKVFEEDLHRIPFIAKKM